MLEIVINKINDCDKFVTVKIQVFCDGKEDNSYYLTRDIRINGIF